MRDRERAARATPMTSGRRRRPRRWCVDVPLFNDPQWTHHWWHHGVQPAASAAVAIRRSRRPLQNTSCVVVVPRGLLGAIRGSPMVRFFFEQILTQGRFVIDSYATSAPAELLPCVPFVAHAKQAWHELGIEPRERWVARGKWNGWPGTDAFLAELAYSRLAMWKACSVVSAPPLRRSRVAVSTPPRYHATIYQRDHTRQLANVDELAAFLRRSHGAVSLLRHDENASPCDLVRSVSASDLLVAPHGFNSILVLFLRPACVLIEIFPDGYSYPMEYQQIAAALRVAPGGLASRVALPNALPQRLLAWLFRDLPEGLLSASWAGTLRMLHHTGHRMQDVVANTTLVGALLRRLRERTEQYRTAEARAPTGEVVTTARARALLAPELDAKGGIAARSLLLGEVGSREYGVQVSL